MHRYDDWRGRRVLDSDDRYIGTLEEVYLDDAGAPTRWAVLHTGVGGRPRGFVPLPGAERSGDDVRLAHPRDRVLAAAEVTPDGELTRAEEERLEELYGLTRGAEMIRSEERVRVGTQVRAAERVRLRKVIVTEDVTITVAVRREEVRLERLDGAPAEDGVDALDASGEPLFEATLYEEVPVVELRVVPRERVRLHKVLVTETRTVTAPRRAERVELVGEDE
jgi:stress response protein YsnF